jgi:tetratricopeptide (TPR) repeat protein
MVDYSKWKTLVDSDDEVQAEIGSSVNPASAAAAAEEKQCCKSDAAQDHLQLGDAAIGQTNYKTALEEYEQVLLALDAAACSIDEHLVSSTLNKAAATLIRLNRYMYLTSTSSTLLHIAVSSQFALELQASTIWCYSLAVADQAFNCPLSSAVLLITISCYAAHRRYEEAEALASRVLSKEPACRQALQLRGEARLKQCKPRIAMLDLSTALPLANGADERNETARLLEAAEAAAGAEVYTPPQLHTLCRMLVSLSSLAYCEHAQR